MSEFDEFDENDSESEGLDPNIRAEIRKAKEYRKQAVEAAAERDAALKDLAFIKAGIPEAGPGALLRKAYDGEMNAEAIRKAAEEYGILVEGNASSATDPILNELERHRSIAGATGTGNSGPSPEDEFLAALGNAQSENEVMALINSTGAESGIYATGMQ